MQKLHPFYLDNYVSASNLFKCNGTNLMLCKFHKEKTVTSQNFINDTFQILMLPTLSVRLQDQYIFKHLKSTLYKSTQDRQSDSACGIHCLSSPGNETD